jgi:hypothetical protein
MESTQRHVICDPGEISGPTYAIQREIEGLVAYLEFSRDESPLTEMNSNSAHKVRDHLASLFGMIELHQLVELRGELRRWHSHFHHYGDFLSDLEDYKMRQNGHRLARLVRDAMVPEVSVVTIGIGKEVIDERVGLKRLQ